MGKAAAIATVRSGGKALLVSRSAEKLDRAAKEVERAADANGDGSVCTYSLDVTDEGAVKRFGQSLASDEWDALVGWRGASRSHWGVVNLRRKIVDGKQILGSGSLLQVYWCKVEGWRVHNLCIWSLGSSSGHELLSSRINERCTGRTDEIVSSRTGTEVTSQLPISWVL